MALQEKYRTRLYAHFVETIDEETADAVLAQFPSRDLDEPVTREFVELKIAELRVELKDEIHRQSDRIMNRMQIVFGIGFAAVALSNALIG